ncbi:hypothetical protein Gohar_013529, partial [Gossypium harknessii]|nr:hypothetical protein [Gossypium harknessii]
MVTSQHSDIDVVVKKILQVSKQGQKEYITKVKVISRLRHRNLVRLLGWSHDRGQFMLVYEFMQNGSLDSHLFSKNCALTWDMRYKICLGLVNALDYLHKNWEQCMVHRDIKTANGMLDFKFNVKLGDFRLGYMAPEYIKTGRPSCKSDVFSFGVVSLKIVCNTPNPYPSPEYDYKAL